MDQVKEYLAVAIKHGFWIGSSIVLIGALTVWYLSTSDLNAKTESQIRKIEGDVQKVSQYRSELPTQPNDLSHQWMNEKIEIRKGEVLQAWQNVFDAQRDILTWPTKLKDDFLIEFKYVKDPETGIVDRNKLKLPFEKYEPFPPSSDTDQVNPELLRRYEQYIGETLPSYAEIAGAKWTADFSKRVGAGGGYGMDDMMMGPARSRQVKVGITGAVEEPVVIWSTSSQETVLKDLFPWRGVKEYPSELDVYYSQENLWILRQLLQIVAAVNGGAQQSFEAEIREIKKLSIGKSVTFNQGSISDPGSRATRGFGGMGMDDMEGYGDMDMYEMDSMGPGGSSLGLDSEGSDPGDSRYVNTANEPIDAATLRSAFSSNDPGQVAIAVAKRVPVMLHLQMNQQSVARLLAACGSAPLMVDVRQVRVMPKGGSSSGGGGSGGGYGDMMGMEDEMMGGMGMGDMGMGGMGGMGGGVTLAAAEEYPMDMEVEIYGLIYFYNPPSEESLGIEKVKDDVSIDESAEVIDALPGPTDTEPATTAEPPATTPPATTPPAATPPAATPPATTPPAAPPPAATPPAAEPPAAEPPAAAPPTAMAIPVATP